MGHYEWSRNSFIGRPSTFNTAFSSVLKPCEPEACWLSLLDPQDQHKPLNMCVK